MATGREHAWDIVLHGIPYRVARVQGIPKWSGSGLARSETVLGQQSDDERTWLSWHSGFGYKHYLYPNTYYYADGIDVSLPRQMILGPRKHIVYTYANTGPTQFFEQSNSLFVLASTNCYQIPLDRSGAAIAKAFAGNQYPRSAVSFNGSTIVWFNDYDSTPCYSFNGGTWTQATTNNIYGKHATTFWSGTTDVLVRDSLSSDDTPAVSWLPQGSAVDSASWGAWYGVGDRSAAITAIAGHERTCWVAKEDGLYYVDSTGRAPQVFRLEIDSNNGRNMMIDSTGRIWYPARRAYIRYDPKTGVAEDVSPGRGMGNDAPIQGRVTAHCQYRQWQYIALWNYDTNTAYIMKGRDREPDEPGNGPMIWHGSLLTVEGVDIWAMHVTYLTTPPRLYFGYGNNTAYITLPRDSENPLQDSGYSYTTSGSIWLPSDDWGLPGAQFQFTGGEVVNDNCAADRYARFYLAQDGREDQHFQDVREAGRAPVNAVRNMGLFSQAMVRLDLKTVNVDTTPIIRAIVGRAARRAPLRDTITTTLLCSDNALSRYGIQARINGLDQLNNLKRARRQESVVLTDWWTGREQERRVLVQVADELLIKETDNIVDYAAQVVLQVLEDETTHTLNISRWQYGFGTYGTAKYSIGPVQQPVVGGYGNASYGTSVYT